MERNAFLILSCTVGREKSAVSHSITWRHPIAVKRVDIDGAEAFAVSGWIPLPFSGYLISSFSYCLVLASIP